MKCLSLSVTTWKIWKRMLCGIVLTNIFHPCLCRQGSRGNFKTIVKSRSVPAGVSQWDFQYPFKVSKLEATLDLKVFFYCQHQT